MSQHPVDACAAMISLTPVCRERPPWVTALRALRRKDRACPGLQTFQRCGIGTIDLDSRQEFIQVLQKEILAEVSGFAGNEGDGRPVLWTGSFLNPCRG